MQEVSAKIYKHICILIANKNAQKIRYAFLHLELCFVASINWDSIIVRASERKFMHKTENGSVAFAVHLRRTHK